MAGTRRRGGAAMRETGCCLDDFENRRLEASVSGHARGQTLETGSDRRKSRRVPATVPGS